MAWIVFGILMVFMAALLLGCDSWDRHGRLPF
jgi:hypothetical protein